MKIEVKEIKPVNPPKEFVITLTQDEANYLRTIVGYIGHNHQDLKDGDVRDKARSFVANLYSHLADKTTNLFVPERSMRL